MNLRAVIGLERMLAVASLRGFGVPLRIIVIVISLVAFHNAVIVTTQVPFYLLPIPAAWLFAGIALFTLFVTSVATFGPRIDVDSVFSPAEHTMSMLAGLDLRSKLFASIARRVRDVSIPILVIAIVSGFTSVHPVDVTSFAITIVAFTIARPSLIVIMGFVVARPQRRAIVAFVGFVASLGFFALYRSFVCTIPLATVPISLVIGALSALYMATAVAKYRTDRRGMARDRRPLERAARMPRLSGACAPLALIIAQTFARPSRAVPGLLLLVVLVSLTRYICLQPVSSETRAVVALGVASLPAILAAFGASSTWSALTGPLWWLHAADVAAAVRGTVFATIIPHVAAVLAIGLTFALYGTEITLALSATALGLGNVVLARVIATASRRRMRNAGITDASGLIEFLEAALALAPVFAIIACAVLLTAYGGISIAFAFAAPLVAFGALWFFAHAVAVRGP